MYKISPSGVSSLLECHRCLWLQLKKDVKRPRGIYPSLPDGMDAAFKNYFDSFRKKGMLPPEIEGKVNAQLFADMGQLNRWREFNFGRGGLRAEIPEFEMIVAGAIDDLLVAPDGKVIPFDFKTRGYPTKENTHEHYQTQLDLYALLLQRNGMRSAKIGYLLFFWPDIYHTDGIRMKTNLVAMEVSPKRALETLAEVHRIISGPMPEADAECEYCRFRSDVGKASPGI